MSNERADALFSIMQVLEQGGYIPQSGTAYQRRVVKGVVERDIELDYRISTISNTKLKRMHPTVRNILRLGAYEILYMDSIPISATVNELVKLTKKKQRRASGMVNAVLRRVENTVCDSVPDKYSMPEWIYDIFVSRFGEDEAVDICSAMLRERHLTLRLNASHISDEEWIRAAQTYGISAENITGSIYRLSGYDSVSAIPGYNRGWWYIQNPSSAMPVYMADITREMRVLDVCAAPGGKAICAADLLRGEGCVEARDISPKKTDQINENIKGSAFNNIKTRTWDATVPDESAVEQFDVVLADVPCSGLGVLSQKPEIKYRLKPQDIDALARIQRKILDTVCRYVKRGGRIVYSTCTVTPQENELQTEAFLERHTDYIRQTQRQIMPDELWDGFYICVMDRR